MKQPCCSIRSDATEWPQEKKTEKTILLKLTAGRPVLRGTRLLGHIKLQNTFPYVSYFSFFSYFFNTGASLAISGHYKALRAAKFHKNGKYQK